MGKIVRALSEDGSVLCCAINSTDIVSEILKFHHTTPTSSAALGRLATGASLMGCMLKGKNNSLTLRVSGKGPAGELVAVADYMGNVKCYANNVAVELPLNDRGKLDVGGYVGKNGFLFVTKDLGENKPYNSACPLVSGEIAEDITSYFAISEQLPTVTALGVLVDTDLSIKAAGGFLLQLLPPINEKAIAIIESNIQKMQSVTEMLEQGHSSEEIALMGLSGLNGNILDSWDAFYHCDCSRERTLGMLKSLPQKDVEYLDSSVEVVCHFCNKKYLFDKAEITAAK